MHLFEVTEDVRPGLKIIRGDGEPRIAVPDGCPFGMRLHNSIIDVINEEEDPPDTVLRLTKASLDIRSEAVVLRPETGPELTALVHVGTAGGVGGKAYMTGGVMQEKKERGWVRRQPSQFPPLGVQPFCTEDDLGRARTGMDILDVLLVMDPGAHFCINRTGDLDDTCRPGESAPRVLSIRWARGRSGKLELTCEQQRRWVPRHQLRTAAGALTA
jgi:hypothetical protein